MSRSGLDELMGDGKGDRWALARALMLERWRLAEITCLLRRSCTAEWPAVRGGDHVCCCDVTSLRQPCRVVFCPAAPGRARVAERHTPCALRVGPRWPVCDAASGGARAQSPRCGVRARSRRTEYRLLGGGMKGWRPPQRGPPWGGGGARRARTGREAAASAAPGPHPTGGASADVTRPWCGAPRRPWLAACPRAGGHGRAAAPPSGRPGVWRARRRVLGAGGRVVFSWADGGAKQPPSRAPDPMR